MAEKESLRIIRAAYGDPGAWRLVVDGDALDPTDLPGLPNAWPRFPRPTDPALEPAHVFHPVPRGGRR